MRIALIITAAFASLSPALAKPSAEASAARQDARQSGLAQSRAARKQKAPKAGEYEPFCVRPFEYPRNAR